MVKCTKIQSDIFWFTTAFTIGLKTLQEF